MPAGCLPCAGAAVELPAGRAMRVSGWPCLSRPQPPVAVVDALGRRRGMLSTAHLSLSGLWTCTMRWDTTAVGRATRAFAKKKPPLPVAFK